ncbi:hypothetical protein Bbelb_297400 [Branchiostoma belcheri]|nr:hypothetical protein Bbelb_297400 [Branchiostoma belcheri]
MSRQPVTLIVMFGTIMTLVTPTHNSAVVRVEDDRGWSDCSKPCGVGFRARMGQCAYNPPALCGVIPADKLCFQSPCKTLQEVLYIPMDSVVAYHMPTNAPDILRVYLRFKCFHNSRHPLPLFGTAEKNGGRYVTLKWRSGILELGFDIGTGPLKIESSVLQRDEWHSVLFTVEPTQVTMRVDHSLTSLREEVRHTRDDIRLRHDGYFWLGTRRGGKQTSQTGSDCDVAMVMLNGQLYDIEAGSGKTKTSPVVTRGGVRIVDASFSGQGHSLKVILCAKLVGTHGILFAAADSKLASVVLLSYRGNTAEATVQFRGRVARVDAQSQLIHEDSVIAIELLVTKEHLILRTPKAMFHTEHNLHLSSADLASLTEVYVGGALVDSGLPDDIANGGKFVGEVYEVWVNDKHYSPTAMDFADVKALTYPVKVTELEKPLEDQFVLSCHDDASTNHVMMADRTWKHDGQEIRKTKSVYVKNTRALESETIFSHLHFTNFSREESGVYVCEGQLAGVSIPQKVVMLKVQMPPNWTSMYDHRDVMYLIIFLAIVSGAFLVGLVVCLLWCRCQPSDHGWRLRRGPPSTPPNLPKGVKKATFKKTMNELRSKLKTIKRMRRESRIMELEEKDRLIPSDASEDENRDQKLAVLEDENNLKEAWGESRVGSLSKMRETPDGAPKSPRSSPLATSKKTAGSASSLAVDSKDDSKRPDFDNTKTTSIVLNLSSHSKDVLVGQSNNIYEAKGEKQVTTKTTADERRRMSVLMSPALFHRASAVATNVISSVDTTSRLEQASRTSTNVKLPKSFKSTLTSESKVSKLSLRESETALMPRLSLSDSIACFPLIRLHLLQDHLHQKVLRDLNPKAYPDLHPKVHPGLHPLQAHPDLHPKAHPDLHPKNHPDLHPLQAHQDLHPLQAHQDLHPKAHPDLHPKNHPDLHPLQAHQDLHPKAHPDLHPNAHPDLHPKTHPDLHPKAHRDLHPLQAHPDLHPKNHPDLHPKNHSDLHPLQAHQDLHPLQAHQDLHPLQAHPDLHPKAHQDLHPLQAHPDLHPKAHQALHPLQAHPDLHPKVQRDLHPLQGHPDLHQKAHPDLHPKAHPDLHPKTHPDLHPKAHPDLHPKAHPDLHPKAHQALHPLQAHPDLHPKVQRDLHPLQGHPDLHQKVHPDLHPLQAHPDLHPKVHPDLHSKVHLDLHPKAHPDLHPKAHPDLHPKAHPDLHPLQAHQDLHPKAHPDLHPLQAHPDLHPKAHPDLHPLQAHPDLHPKAHPDLHPLQAHPDLQPKAHRDLHPKTHPDLHPRAHPDLHLPRHFHPEEEKGLELQ